MSHKSLDTAALHSLAEYYRNALSAIQAELEARARSERRRAEMRDHFAATGAAGYTAKARIAQGGDPAEVVAAVAYEMGLTPEAVREGLRFARRRRRP